MNTLLPPPPGPPLPLPAPPAILIQQGIVGKYLGGKSTMLQ